MKDTVAELAIIRQTTHQGIRSLTLTELLLCVLGIETFPLCGFVTKLEKQNSLVNPIIFFQAFPCNTQ